MRWFHFRVPRREASAEFCLSSGEMTQYVTWCCCYPGPAHGVPRRGRHSVEGIFVQTAPGNSLLALCHSEICLLCSERNDLFRMLRSVRPTTGMTASMKKQPCRARSHSPIPLCSLFPNRKRPRYRGSSCGMQKQDLCRYVLCLVSSVL